MTRLAMAFFTLLYQFSLELTNWSRMEMYRFTNLHDTKRELKASLNLDFEGGSGIVRADKAKQAYNQHNDLSWFKPVYEAE